MATMLKLWGEPAATGTLKAIWALEELNLPYNRADGPPDPSVVAADCRRSGVAVQAPPLCFQDDDFTLCESHAILRYLCNAHAPDSALYPADPKARADIDSWLDFQATAMEPPAHTVFTGMGHTGARDDRTISAALRDWAGQWRALEARLARTRFIAGGQFTLADIAFGPVLHRWFALRIPGQPAMPHVRAWYDMLLSRPAYRSHLALPLAQVQWTNLPAAARPSPPAGHWFRYDANKMVLTAAAAQRAIRMPVLAAP
jgi:glutathione S-transferase